MRSCLSSLCAVPRPTRKAAADLRLFVGVYPPPEAAEAMLREASLLDLPPGRAASPEQVHLTAQFIGDTPPRALPEVIESIARSCAGLPPISLAPIALRTIPPKRGRLLAAILDDQPILTELVTRLARRLARPPRARPSDRFLPHCTLVRFEHGREATIDAPIAIAPFPVAEARLMRSRLLPTGAEHEVLERFPLDGPGHAPEPRGAPQDES